MAASSRPRRWRRRRLRSMPSAIRGTRLGLVYIGLIFLVALAATNTGNNTLFMVLALLLGLLAVSGFVSRSNVRSLAVEMKAPNELYANRPFQLDLQLRNKARWWPRWFLLLQPLSRPPEHVPDDLDPLDTSSPKGADDTASTSQSRRKKRPSKDQGSTSSPWLVSRLGPRRQIDGSIPCVFPFRGRQRIRGIRITSLFPFGLFQKGQLYEVEAELLVYPELYPAGAEAVQQETQVGPSSRQRRGWGHDLHELRGFREGDDPRNIHWKRSALTGDLVYKEREAEEGRRLSILFDNRVDASLLDARGTLRHGEDFRRFERLISEAATVADSYLDSGFELELVTRESRLPFAAGTRQRLAVLETLALLQPTVAQRDDKALRSGDERAPTLRLGLRQGVEKDAREVAA